MIHLPPGRVAADILQQLFPEHWTRLDEDQVFLAVQNGQATEASLLAHVHCEAQGIQERIPVKLVTGPVREALIKRFAEKTPPERVTALQCAQRLPNEAAVRLVWDKGVATPTGMATTGPPVPNWKLVAPCTGVPDSSRKVFLS